jgi:2-polyprenyl-6-methoxyphenol hydroxylase-like FAD-dependent oxidoreductase
MQMGKRKPRSQLLEILSNKVVSFQYLGISLNLLRKNAVTSEFEILRGDMAKILYDTIKDMDGIKHVFDETIVNIEEKSPGKVEVTFANHLQPTIYDLVVGADGMMSRTRRIVFGHGPKNDDYLYRLGQYAAYFTIPKTAEDTRFAQWYNASRGRLILKRPDQYGTTRIYISVTDANLSRFDEIEARLRDKGRVEQQKWFEKEFEGAGWQTARVIEGMKEADDFYMQQIAQVKMPKWTKGHIALVGDAAYAPSPISGVVSTENGCINIG